MITRLLVATTCALVALGAVAAVAGAHEGEEHAGWDVKLLAAPQKAGEVDPIRFEVRDAKGRPLTSYDAVHARELHAWLVRTDEDGRLSDYMHVHPSRIGGGTWELNDGALPEPGTWNLVVDTTSKGVQGFGTAMFEVGGKAPAHTAHVDRTHGHVARIVSTEPKDDGTAIMRVRISTLDGTPVTDVQEHIGATAHWASFLGRRDGVRGTVHAHAMSGVDSDGVIEFDVAPPEGTALSDATGGWIELRTASTGVCVIPLRPSGMGARAGDGLMLRLRTAMSQGGLVVGSTDGSGGGHDMANMPGMDHSAHGG